MVQSRRMMVLRAIVEDYIRSQEPVGSAALARKHDLGVSSATIRNDMAALEDEGYLIQPHTSAGRVPTEKGYRYFVDRISTVVPLSAAQKRGIETFLSGSVSLQDTLQRAARLLSGITGQVAVVASPSPARAKVRRIQMVPVSTNVLLAVVVTDAGGVAQHTMTVFPQPDDRTVGEMTESLNAACVGLSFAKCAVKARSLAVATAPETVMRGLYAAMANVFDAMGDNERSGELYMAGASHLAHQPDVAQLAPLFDALEEQVVLMRLMTSLSEEADANGVGVAIGSETHTPGLLHASVVTSGYGGLPSNAESDGAKDAGSGQRQIGHSRSHDDHAGVADDNVPDVGVPDVGVPGDDVPGDDVANTDSGAPIAFVGSIGPTHMDYVTTIAAVRAVARYLTRILAGSPGPADPAD
ncbi:heat-inducible transcriptional repressor HrcA [Bifidobacterium leontopitheci]|uniref:Heat-inducible transcription repressor HrcA n=1 Tax=Bifidobacterium leontopitheci TaxID=2650774 RepID=A0A6I1GGM9_9BIFI|nr:heat-inducible transcriptional repressor HrcA [Bifidobacterium leontopitheci]KAB7790790.1 HrcA family transcriptional regulator [Bifidobacterium leontopitheci]